MGEFTTCLSNWFHHQTALSVNTFFLISNQNLFLNQLKPIRSSSVLSAAHIFALNKWCKILQIPSKGSSTTMVLKILSLQCPLHSKMGAQLMDAWNLGELQRLEQYQTDDSYLWCACGTSERVSWNSRGPRSTFWKGSRAVTTTYSYACFSGDKAYSFQQILWESHTPKELRTTVLEGLLKNL